MYDFYQVYNTMEQKEGRKEGGNLHLNFQKYSKKSILILSVFMIIKFVLENAT